MDMQTQVPQAPADGSATHAYVLTHLELYNWGAFAGRHSARIDLAGTAIVGPTGSGKTTLVDALMTLLTASPRYNLASTGGYDSDRDLELLRCEVVHERLPLRLTDQRRSAIGYLVVVRLRFSQVQEN